MTRLLYAGLIAAAMSANAQTYEWKDAHGGRQSSHALPDPGTFTDLRVIERDAAMSPLERRTLEIVNEAARATLSPLPQPSKLPPDAEATGPASRLPASENVRDPCLLSWDPQCVEKHAGDYDPRLGYAPSVLRGATASADRSPPRAAP